MSEWFTNEFERLNSEKIRLEDRLWKCKTSKYECIVAKSPGIDDDVYDVVMEKMGRGGDIK